MNKYARIDMTTSVGAAVAAAALGLDAGSYEGMVIPDMGASSSAAGLLAGTSASSSSGASDTRNSGGGVPETKERFARENHSEIERRRRNKMTHYINELAEMVPQCAALGRKPDKLTILRMAVSHMKTIREVSSGSVDPSSYKPSFLTDQELKHLILEAANGFLFVISCDTGRVLYVADSILPVLNLMQVRIFMIFYGFLGHNVGSNCVRNKKIVFELKNQKIDFFLGENVKIDRLPYENVLNYKKF